MNARFQESGRYTEIPQTSILVKLAKIIIDNGSSKEYPKLIPSSIIISRASINCINGHTKTRSNRDTIEVPDRLKSETNR